MLIVPPPSTVTDVEEVREKGFQNIMVGCDFSADSNSALQYAFSLAQEFQSVLHLVHVIEPVTYRDVIFPEGMLDEVEDILKGQPFEGLQKPQSHIRWGHAVPSPVRRHR